VCGAETAIIAGVCRLHRTTVELDRDAIAQAARHLGTHDDKKTIDAALREVNRRAAATV
jgi:Arc/MetJ family transcription regulator